MGDIRKPRRRIVMQATIEADSWGELYVHLRNLTIKMAANKGYELSRSSVFGGYSSDHIIAIDEDESITHDSWFFDMEAWLTERDQAHAAVEGE